MAARQIAPRSVAGFGVAGNTLNGQGASAVRTTPIRVLDAVNPLFEIKRTWAVVAVANAVRAPESRPADFNVIGQSQNAVFWLVANPAVEPNGDIVH